MSDLELPDYCLRVLSMLAPVPRASLDVHAQVMGGAEGGKGGGGWRLTPFGCGVQACVLYIMRVGIIEQMGEAAQRQLAKPLTNQVSPSPPHHPSRMPPAHLTYGGPWSGCSSSLSRN